MNSSTWGASVEIKPWFTSFDSLSDGDLVDIVVSVITVDSSNDMVLGTIFPGFQRVRISGVSCNQHDIDSISVFGAIYKGNSGIQCFATDNHSKVMTFPKIDKSDLDTLVEFCAGMGISTFGFQRSGYSIAVANELRPKMASLYAELHPGIPVVVGDMCCPDTIFKVWEKRPRSSVMFSGFACQPYSKGGKQLGVEDQRSSTVRASLKAAFMLRAPALVLECVKEAGSNSYVQHEINSFCSQCGFHKSEIILSMEDCWPVRRERWWIVISAPMIGSIPLRKCPFLPQPCSIGMIMNGPLLLTDDEISQLEIFEEEYAKILMYVQDIRSLFLKTQTKAPTALHAWGAQVLPCPCDCRGAFTESTLRSRGVYGVVIPLPGSISVNDVLQPRIRHPHPSEVAAWNCVPFEGTWPDDLRLVLTGLGQMATPIHAAWISSQVKMHVEQLVQGFLTSDCQRVLDNIRMSVLLQCKSLFPPRDLEQPTLFVESLPRVLPVEEFLVDDIGDSIPCVAELTSMEVQDACPWWFGLNHVGQSNQATVVLPEGAIPLIVTLSNPESTPVESLRIGEMDLSRTKHCSIVDCSTKIQLDGDELAAGRCVALLDEHDGVIPKPFDDMDPCESIVDDGYLDGSADDNDMSPISPTWPFSIQNEQVSERDKAGECHVPLSFDSFGEDPHELGMDLEVEHEAEMHNDTYVPSLVEVHDEPLCCLHADQLIRIQAPIVSSLYALDSFCNQTMLSAARRQILHNQGSLMGDDEIRFHACSLMDSCSHSDWFFLDPILAHSIMMKSDAHLLHAWVNSLTCEPKVVLSVIWIGGHWIPFHASSTKSCLHVSSWDESGNFPAPFKTFVDLLAKELSCSTFVIRVEHRRFDAKGYCGICSIRFLAEVVKGRMLPTCTQELFELHQIGQSMFVKQLLESPSCPRPWIWGHGLSSQASDRLRELLIQHGVPKEQTDTRIHLMLATLGTASVQNALLGSSPWRSIKALSNNVKPIFQLVLPEELEAHVQAKSQQGQLGKKKRSKQSATPAPGLPPPLDPQKLALEVGAFVREDDRPLKQLQLNAVGPLAEGIVVSTVHSAQAFLSANQLVNDLTLGLLIVNACEKDMTTSLQWEHLRVPFRCLANNEPVLVSAYLVQLGGSKAKQAQRKPKIDLVPDQVSCVKVSVFRDLIDTNWNEFSRSPIKYILSHIESLTLCSQDGCLDDGQCQKWHRPDTSSLADPIADVWRRQWVSSDYKACPAPDAEIFLVNIRYAATQEQQVLQGSGYAGIFMEPRSVDSKSPSLTYQVLWLPRISFAEAERLNQCTPAALGIARMSGKFGLRVLAKDAPETGRLLKPGSVYLAAGPRINFEVGPLPYGLDRIAVSKLCLAWNWQARPLHTQRSLSGTYGAVWLVQACVEPDSNVHRMAHGDVVISRIGDSRPNLGDEVCEVVGSGKTVALCALPSSKDATPQSSDPWFGKDAKDPWSGYISKVNLPKNAPQPPETIKQVEHRIEKAVISKLTVDPSDQSALVADVASHKQVTDQRLAVLEEQISRIASDQKAIDSKLVESAQKQDAEMSQLRHQVTAQIDAQGSRMESLFHQQMQSIEQLLSKRSRSPRRDS